MSDYNNPHSNNITPEEKIHLNHGDHLVGHEPEILRQQPFDE